MSLNPNTTDDPAVKSPSVRILLAKISKIALRAFVTGVFTIILAWSWWGGLLDSIVPPPSRVLLAIDNWWSETPQRSEDSFRVVVSWLEDDDSTGVDTRNVARAFTSVAGIELVRSARIVTSFGAYDEWHQEMQNSATSLLEDWNADLAVVGVVKKPREVLSLWLVPRSGGGTLSRGDQPYVLEDVTLGEDFHEDLSAQLVSTALAAVASLADTEVRGQALDRGLRVAVNQLAHLLESQSALGREREAILNVALGNSLVTLGERERGTDLFKEAVQAYNTALDVYTREQNPHPWATTQINLGNALLNLGQRLENEG